MPTTSDIEWFKREFHAPIAKATAGTPFDLSMLCAIACQETGYIWSVLRKKGMATAAILKLCVGDTLDSDKGRSAFPKTKADLVAWKDGQAMFGIAHQGLVDMAVHIPGYSGVAARPAKFCHGFGIFQYDLQFFKTDPDHFLQRRYAEFGPSLAKCLTELKRGLKTLGWSDRTRLTDYEMACVAIAYNTGGFKPGAGLKQGHNDGKKYYGELFFDYLTLARTVADPVETPEPPVVEMAGTWFRVDTTTTTLNLRSSPGRDPKRPKANWVADLPDGQLVRVAVNVPVNGFLPVETRLDGVLMQGFASADFLVEVPTPAEAVVAPAPVAPTPVAPTPVAPIAVAAVPVHRFPEAHLTRKSGSVTKRTEKAWAHSLNEPGQPGRTGGGGQGVKDIGRIIAWLASDNAAHVRYQPTSTNTFCNVYAHDYCHLAGVYLPRVWWSSRALLDMQAGRTVEPLYGKTVDEIRANNLFRWLSDFGPDYGWRRVTTPDELQAAANAGGIGVIVARRKLEGRSGHIVLVAPENDARHAKRDAAGRVLQPLQSQAGSVNFRYGFGRPDWWKGEQFAESAFWVHA
jgi:hypothetical protein